MVNGQTSQEVCPWNPFSTDTEEAAFLPRDGVDGASLIELMGLTQEEFSRRFKGSAVKRTKRRGLLRNVAVALGRIASREGCPSETVFGIAALLTSRILVEEYEWVRGELAVGIEPPRQANTLVDNVVYVVKWIVGLFCITVLGASLAWLLLVLIFGSSAVFLQLVLAVTSRILDNLS